jgi:ATP-binding cassette subfamily B multidrug efflux pump
MMESTERKADNHQPSRASVLKRMLREAAPYRNRMLLALLLSLLLAIQAPVRPWLIQLTINMGISHPENAWYLKGPGAFIIELTLIQIVLLLLETGMKYLFTITTASLGQHVVNDLRQKIHRSILQQPLSMFDRSPVGMLTTRTINDIESVNDVFSDGFIPIMADLLTIISVLVYMFGIDWQMTLICLVPFPFLLLATWIFKESVNRSFMRVRQAVTQLNTFVQEHLSGMSVVQAFTAEAAEQKKFEAINLEHREANVRAIFAYSVFFPVVELASALSIGFLVWWAAYASTQASVEQQAEMVSKATAFILCIQLLFRPLRIIADKFNVLQMGMIAAGRVFQVMDQPKETDVVLKGIESDNSTYGEVVFDQVSFSYVPGQPVLKDVSFRVPVGSSLAIVGKTGSGKTTLASLLCRLYAWDRGDILLGDKPIRKIPLDQLRAQIGVVMQDAFLFSGSLLDNITLRNPDISEEAVWRAIGRVGLTEWVNQLPGKLQYPVLERGNGLSMGQRQLITFIRAVLYDPPILILDEATASVDAQTEQWIRQSMREMLRGRTSIIIAHRLSTIREADAVLVMDSGEVKEWGRPADLISLDGWFAALHRQQWVSEDGQDSQNNRP